MLRACAHRFARFTLGLALAMACAVVFAPPARANFASDCSGCHNAANEKHYNAAGAGNILTYANNTMGATFTGGSTADSIAAEIAATLPALNPANEAITFQTPKTFDLPNLWHSTAQGPGGATSSASTVSAPGKGTVSYPVVGSGARYQATYTPNACQTGGDSFTYRASGSGGSTSTRTATVVIGNPTSPPTINSAAPPGGQTGVPYSHAVTVSSCPSLATFTLASGALPPGLSLSGSGAITGSPATQGTFTGTIQATYVGGQSGSQAFSITITLGPPVVTSSGTAPAGAVGVAYAGYQITASNGPITGYGATGLPPGLTVNTSSGLISGTPTDSSGSPYTANVTATNATGTGNRNVTLVVESTPVITSPGTASGQTASAFLYTITATNAPTTFSATGLPPGLTLNTATGAISGTPTSPGTFNATMTAANGAGSDTDPLVITIALGAPAITSATTAGGSIGSPFSYQITATNSPTSYGATGLPSGLSINAGTGLISGTPTVTGTFSVTLSATNATGTGTQGLTITLGAGVPVITSAGTASGGTGAPFIYQVTATNSPTSYGATGLPTGLSINPATGLITGTPAAAGTFSANVSATNASGTGTGALTITVSQLPPTVVTGTPVTGVSGVPFSHTIQAGNGATGFTATGLPPGLTLDGASGIISGTPTAGGTYGVTIGVTNSAGTTTFTLTIIIAFPLPTVTDTTAGVPFETATTITLPVTGEGFSINIVRLPEHGLVTVQAGSRVATYTPAIGYVGADSFAYTATNSAGTSAAATVRITVTPVPPTSRAAAMTVQLNTPTTFSLAPFIKGAGLTGVAIRGAPRHGTVTVNGLSVTYTPRTDFFGTDTFGYVAFGSLGTSNPATVTVEVVGRPDPSRDRDVTGLIEAQNQAARRFAGAQIANLNRRMESLHRSDQSPAPPPEAEPAPATTTGASSGAPVRLAAAPAQGSIASDATPFNLAATMAQLVTTGPLPVEGSTTVRGGTTLWIAGSANFGNVDGADGRGGSRFGTDGVSIGVDRRFGERFAGGIGAGFARDESKVGSGATRSKARGASIAAYGSFQAGPRTFIDALLGYGALRFDSRRYVSAVDDFASARRDGNQLFGSVAGGYEWVRDNLLVSPYGRADFSIDRLDAVSESGAGSYALAYGAQNQRSVQGALGVRAESKHETDFGWAVPRARAEYRREFGGDRRATLTYADLLGGPEYSIAPAGTSRNSLLFGLGADLVFRGGLRFGVDYTAQRSSGAANVQGIRLFVSQDLDAPGASPWRFEPLLLKSPINVDFSYSYDDNTNRGREAFEKRPDNVFGVSANQSWSWTFREHLRAQATWLASGEKFDRYAGLGRFSLGGQGEIQYRTSGAFTATTFALVGRAHYEQYESYYRTGPRYYLGFNTRRALTDRIEVFGEIGANVRQGRSEVFRWRDYAAKFNLDYALGRKGVLYFTGEYRRGDTVSTGFASLANVGVADVFVPDDAFEGDFLSYRFDARTIFATVGVNYPLGARDSIDFSWRGVQSTPRKRLAFDFSGPRSYMDNQYSIVYLMRF